MDVTQERLLQSGTESDTPPELSAPDYVIFAYLCILSRNIRYIEHKNSVKIISKRSRHVYRCEMGLKQKDCHAALRNQQEAFCWGRILTVSDVVGANIIFKLGTGVSDCIARQYRGGYAGLNWDGVFTAYKNSHFGPNFTPLGTLNLF